MRVPGARFNCCSAGCRTQPSTLMHKRGSVKKFPEFFYWPFLCASFAEIGRCNLEKATRQLAGTVVSASRQSTESQFACCATIPSREKHSCHHKNHRILRISLRVTEKWVSRGHFSLPWRTSYRMRLLRKISPVLPTMAGSKEQVCACVRYHNSGNVLTAHRMYALQLLILAQLQLLPVLVLWIWNEMRDDDFSLHSTVAYIPLNSPGGNSL
jgi:hypothetical protein